MHYHIVMWGLSCKDYTVCRMVQRRCADVQCVGPYICTKVYKRIYQEGWRVTKWKRQVRQGDGFANKASRTDRVCTYHTHTYIYIFIIKLYTIHAHCGLWVTTRNKFPASSLHIQGNWVVSCVYTYYVYTYTLRHLYYIHPSVVPRCYTRA